MVSSLLEGILAICLGISNFHFVFYKKNNGFVVYNGGFKESSYNAVLTSFGLTALLDFQLVLTGS